VVRGSVESGECFDDAVAYGGRCNPGEGPARRRESVEGEGESGRGEDEPWRLSQVVVRLVGDVEADDEGAEDGTFEVDVEQ
jgi:hypothetical protein